MKATLQATQELQKLAQQRRHDYKAQPKTFPLVPAFDFSEVAKKEREASMPYHSSLQLKNNRVL